MKYTKLGNSDLTVSRICMGSRNHCYFQEIVRIGNQHRGLQTVALFLQEIYIKLNEKLSFLHLISLAYMSFKTFPV